jgi:hypothetical protein
VFYSAVLPFSNKQIAKFPLTSNSKIRVKRKAELNLVRIFCSSGPSLTREYQSDNQKAQGDLHVDQGDRGE